jgi:hypothetical protein
LFRIHFRVTWWTRSHAGSGDCIRSLRARAVACRPPRPFSAQLQLPLRTPRARREALRPMLAPCFPANVALITTVPPILERRSLLDTNGVPCILSMPHGHTWWQLRSVGSDGASRYGRSDRADGFA